MWVKIPSENSSDDDSTKPKRADILAVTTFIPCFNANIGIVI